MLSLYLSLYSNLSPLLSFSLSHFSLSSPLPPIISSPPPTTPIPPIPLSATFYLTLSFLLSPLQSIQFYHAATCSLLAHPIFSQHFISYRQICRRFYAGVIGPSYLPFLEFQRRWGRKQITTVGQAFLLLLREIPGK